jgi:Zn-dependent peptidase ImmA (M78 family)
VLESAVLTRTDIGRCGRVTLTRAEAGGQPDLTSFTLLCAWLGVSPSQFFSPILQRLQAFAFSAATFDIEGHKIIVFSPLRAAGRRNSDIAHELAHLMLRHDLSEVRDLNGMPFRTCRPDEEEEATAFGGTLLLPRPLLLTAARRKATVEQIASHYVVTTEMARFRYNSTGVARQAGGRGA